MAGQNLGGEQTWQALFETTDASEAERLATARGYTCEWSAAAEEGLGPTLTLLSARLEAVLPEAPGAGGVVRPERFWNQASNVFSFVPCWGDGEQPTNVCLPCRSPLPALRVAGSRGDSTRKAGRLCCLPSVVCLLPHSSVSTYHPTALAECHWALTSLRCPGTPIEDEVLEGLNAAIWHSAVAFQWSAGDVLCLDNELAQHGRMSFEGPRELVVAFSKL